MHKIFTLVRSETVGVGETFEHEGRLFVVTNIIDIKKYQGNGKIKVDVLAQEFGTKSILHAFGMMDDYWEGYERRYYGGKETEGNPFLKVGDVVQLGLEKDGLYGYIANIVDLRYEGNDFVMKCGVEIYMPWSDEAMRQAVKQKRLATFNVVSGKGNDQTLTKK
ncbi:hypothetical protein [Candidatus Enterococcus ferrettii]|uniref:YopX protein domain-containing protein n=1 Tax=Candidatus Enterococcus ferrettii TaxID=2815324 RepID=A0ABV0ETL8_9ENTE|nr:hypothetical protein [Enterococcus sp. 665A]MBO1340242.1 hypothetical protein [Enterococcus sp. 665A]